VNGARVSQPAPAFDAGGFSRRLEEVRHRIASSSADPDAVRIVAVTKGFGAEAVRAALGAGLTQIGENYADELMAKSRSVGPGSGAVWHFLGTVQRNKVARLVPVVTWWQGVSRVEEGQAIARRRPGSKVLVQVEVAQRPGRNGCPPDQVPDLVRALRDEALDLAGLMAVGPPGPPEDARPGFALVSSLADSLALPVRSMGMSDDLEVALAEGSTMVRLGRALFGRRPTGPTGPPPPRSGPETGA
jgi:pyridoxal phosphate enzyme (YggS family)